MLSKTIESKVLLGVFLAILARLCFSITYAFYKASVPFLANTSVVFFQSLFSLCILLPLILYKRAPLWSPSKLKFICLRGLLGLGSLFALTFALKTENFAETTLLKSTAPLFVPFLAGFFLREKMKHSSWPYILMGFLGVALVLNPGIHGMDQGLWFALLSGVLSACLIITVRYIAHEPFLTLLFYYFLIICLGALPFAFLSWETPNPLVWAYLILAAISMLCGQFSLTAAMRRLSAQTMAPMSYLIVVFSFFIGWIVWGESLRLSAFIGMSLVIFSGIMIALRSSKKASSDAIVLVDPISSGALLKQTARSLGYHVIALYTHEKDLYRQHRMKEEDFFEACDTVIFETDLQKILQKLKKLPHSIKGCIPASESGVEYAEKIAPALKLVANPTNLMNARRDKGQMRELLAKSPLSCPQFSLCSSVEKIKEFADTHIFPLVIKTPKGASADLVFICQDSSHLVDYFHKIINTKNAFGSNTTSAVVEEYIDGKEYAVNTFSDGSRIFVTSVWIYNKIPGGQISALYDSRVLIPLEEPSIQSLISYAKKVVALFEIEKGPAHLEIKDDSRRGPTLIEIGARFSGGSTPYLIRKHSNFDPFLAAVEVFTKGKTTVPQPIVYKKHIANANCPIKEGGKVVRIHGIHEIEDLPSYDHLVLSIKEGDTIPASTSLRTVPCRIFLAHESKEQCLKDTKRAHELFSIEFEGGRRSSPLSEGVS